MPDQQQQAPQKTSSAPAVQETTAITENSQSRYGNSFLQDQLRQRQSPGRLTWQGALGDTMGGKLYDALSAQLTDDKLLGHANSAVDSAMSKLKSELAGQVQLSDQEAASMFVSHLDQSLRQIAQQAVVASGLSEGIRDVADANPYSIALAAAAGAVAYVLSNQDLPVIEGKLGIGGGHSLVAGLDPGRTMKLAVEQVRLGYRYQGDKVAALLNLNRFSDGFSADGKFQYSPQPDTQIALSGSHSDRGGEQQTKLDLNYMNPSVMANIGMQRNVGGANPGQSIGASLSSRGGPGELQRSVSGQWRSDNSWEAAAGIGRSSQNESWSVEAFGGRDAAGQENVGIRALYKLRF